MRTLKHLGSEAETTRIVSKDPNTQPSVDTISKSFSQSITLTSVDAPNISNSNQVGTSMATVRNVLDGTTQVLEFPKFVCETVKPLPEYESWDPLPCAVWKNSGFDELPYVPYADQPNFPVEEYADAFYKFKEMRDVDGKLGFIYTYDYSS